MELYIGGFAQGKLSYVREKYPHASVFDERDFQELWEMTGQKKERKEMILWNHFHLSVKKLLEEGLDQEEIWMRVERLTERFPDLILISDEIGNGIVPLQREERTYRETTGRLLCRIAKKACLVERIICGLPQRIK